MQERDLCKLSKKKNRSARKQKPWTQRKKPRNTIKSGRGRKMWESISLTTAATAVNNIGKVLSEKEHSHSPSFLFQAQGIFTIPFSSIYIYLCKFFGFIWHAYIELSIGLPAYCLLISGLIPIHTLMLRIQICIYLKLLCCRILLFWLEKVHWWLV